MIILFILYFLQVLYPQKEGLIIDSELTFDEAIAGISIPEDILKQLELVNVQYYSFDAKLHQGQLLVNKKVKKDVQEIFDIIKATKFPIDKVIPIVKYNWDDENSMMDNNTSAFNYRNVKGTKIKSYHSYGLAIDINPLQNPHFKGGKTYPKNANYNPKNKGTFTNENLIVKEFKKRGWSWGGNWKSSKDYQHFEKRLK